MIIKLNQDFTISAILGRRESESLCSNLSYLQSIVVHMFYLLFIKCTSIWWILHIGYIWFYKSWKMLIIGFLDILINKHKCRFLMFYLINGDHLVLFAFLVYLILYPIWEMHVIMLRGILEI